ncbi:ELL2 factor, partial [Calonectris borealis]|nr:ELL2 factor [Calonectris borealis]
CAYFSIRKYIAIVSNEQRQSYKDDFNAEYDEYRILHARIESITRRFMKLDAQRKLLSPGSKEYQVKKDKTVKIVFHLPLTPSKSPCF